MHRQREVANVLSLVEQGLNDCQISRTTGIPRRTILDWRHGRLPGSSASRPTLCFRCDSTSAPLVEYAYVLGLYLGDGCISRVPRTYKIRFTLDAAYPGIIKECARALELLVPGKRAWSGLRPSSRCVDLTMYWNHWPCVFPQHGPGRKHERRIRLTDWQRANLENHREPLLRGLIHSDGCRVVASDRGLRSVRYHFTNVSADIRRVYCWALDGLDIPWTQPSPREIAVYRRDAVRRLDDFVGPKA